VTVYDNACMCKNLLGKGAGVVCWGFKKHGVGG
jgi:hypothetical protein